MSNKAAYVNVTYLYMFEPNELGLDDNCSEEEFNNAVSNFMSNELERVHDLTELSHNDVDISIVGDFE